jgi:hypothetical protein
VPPPVWRGIDGIDGAQQAEVALLPSEPARAPAPTRGQSAEYWFDVFSDKLNAAPAAIEAMWNDWMDAQNTPQAQEVAADLNDTDAGRWLLRTWREWQSAMKLEALA